MERCNWCLCNEKMMRYHDEERGTPLHDDRKQFEFLTMEVMQCDLNWNMMIQKREIFCQCFNGFDYERIALHAEADTERILTSGGMVRLRRKMEAVIHNARCFRAVREESDSFSRYPWRFSKGRTLLYSGHQEGKIPAKNSLSDEVNKDLKYRGFKCLGPVIVYSYLQACGITNDHRKGCFCHREIVEQYLVVRKWDQWKIRSCPGRLTILTGKDTILCHPIPRW